MKKFFWDCEFECYIVERITNKFDSTESYKIGGWSIIEEATYTLCGVDKNHLIKSNNSNIIIKAFPIEICIHIQLSKSIFATFNTLVGGVSCAWSIPTHKKNFFNF